MLAFKKISFLFIFLLSIGLNSKTFGQDNTLDSLIKIEKSLPNDSTKVITLNEIARYI